MSNLELRLKELGYTFIKEQEVTYGLRSGIVKIYTKPTGKGYDAKVYICRDYIVSTDGVSKKDLKAIRGY